MVTLSSTKTALFMESAEMAMDTWFFVNDAGEIVKRVENDGWYYMRHGADAVDTVVTEEYVKEHYPDYYRHYIEPALRGYRDAHR